MTISAGVALAEVDLSDFDDEVMRAMDFANQDLELSIGAKNTQTATRDASALAETYQWADEYFTRKGGADDAVRIAKSGRSLVTKLEADLARNDFEAAQQTQRDTAANCKTCHDIYK